MSAVLRRERVAAAYIVSVVSAVAVVLVAGVLSQPGFFAHRIYEIVFLGLVISTIATLVGVAITIVPCVLLAVFTERLKIQSWTFYLFSGLVLGLVMLPATTKFADQFSWYTDPDPPVTTNWRQVFEHTGPIYALAGCIAGIIYWRIAGRHNR
jgi:Kef-type K+ transport system membrane component KefB